MPPDVTADVGAAMDAPPEDRAILVDVVKDRVTPDVPVDSPRDRADATVVDTGPRCPTGDTNCAGLCVNTLADRTNCGMCGNVCPGTQVCLEGGCSIACTAPEVLCAGRCANLQTDTMFCGRCSNACRDPPGATARCVRGACEFVCNANRADCGNPADGCETDLQSSLAHCGACGNTCRVIGPNRGPPSCVGGRCLQGACLAGYGDCDGNGANGCETSLASNGQHCGRCGNVCVSPMVCLSPTDECGCQGGRIFCEGACVDLQTNRDHCGRCGNRCAATEVCSAGACSRRCSVNETVCGDVICANLQNDTNHCGRCYNVCAFGRTCRDGVCAP